MASFIPAAPAQTLTLTAAGAGKYISGDFRITPDMAPAGVIMTAIGHFAPNMPDDQPPKVGYVATLFKDGKQFNLARFPLKVSSTSNSNPSFKERLFFLEGPQDGAFRMELQAVTPETIKLDRVDIELRANLQEADGRIVSGAMVLLIFAGLGFLI
jgi:hypothetical protein